MSRISENELKKATTSLKGKNEGKTLSYVLFDEEGRVIRPNERYEEENVFGRILTGGDKERYEVRASRRDKSLWNPFDRLYVEQAKMQAQNMGFKNSPSVLYSCNKECFDQYMKFLQTKHSNYFTKAERELGKDAN